jgi:ABC-2 type transport system ATP-binding protein
MEELESSFFEVRVSPGEEHAARALRPIHERQALGSTVMLFDAVDRQRLAALGEVRNPSLADLFVAVLAGGNREAAR